MATRGGGRDLSVIVETRFFFDKEFSDDYCLLWKCLSPSLQFSEPFPLLRLEKNDQLIRLNDEDIRGKSPKYVFDRLKGLKVNEKDTNPRGLEVVRLVCIKGKDLIPERHLYAKVLMLFFIVLIYT